MFFAFVGVTVVLAGAALYFFYEANRLRVAYATSPEVDYSILEETAATNDKLLGAQKGLADDRVLGGEAGETKRSQKLGAQRIPINVAMTAVSKEVSSGNWHPTTLNAEQLAILERLDMGGITPEMILAAAGNQESVAAGMQVFKANCAACHGVQGNGLVGPNLTDKYWIHGSGPTNVYKVISQGVAAKGMPPWGHLGEEKMKLAAAYVLSIKGKNIPGKAPQGVDADGNPPAPNDG